jgi:TonB family protein
VRIRPGRALSAAACAALAAAAMTAAAQGARIDLQVPPQRKLDTAEQLEAAVHELHKRAWQMYVGVYIAEPDPRGRSASQDVDEWLLTAPNEQQLQQLLARAREQGAAHQDAALRDTLDRAAALTQREDYRQQLLNAYWWYQYWISHHEANLRALEERDTAQQRTARRGRIAPVEARLAQELSKAMLADSSAAQQAALERMKILCLEVFKVLNEERAELAGQTSAAAGQNLPRERSTPCPPGSGRTSGVERPKFSAGSHATEEFYPPDSKRDRFEGVVEVQAVVSATGCMLKASVARSSGAAALDEAALRWAESAGFDPAEHDHHAIEATMVFRVKFQMSDTPRQ